MLFGMAGFSIAFPKLIDFSVYWYDIHAHFQQGLPLYGPRAAFAAPMIFRYPPLFALLFYPFSLCSFRTAGTLWALFEATGSSLVTAWSYRKLGLKIGWWQGVAALVICAPYFYLSFKDGNVQWLITLLTFGAILLVEERPNAAGFLLALAIAIKLWPVLFLPLFAARARRRAVLWIGVWSVILWLAPILCFGAAQYGSMLQTWVHQESGTMLASVDIWYPSQSLRGLLLRFFTDPRMTQPYHGEFPDVHLVCIAPQWVIGGWLVVSGIAFIYFIRRQSDEFHFIVFSALQPFCNWSSLISVTPAVLVAAHFAAKGRSRVVFAITAAVSAVLLTTSLSRSAVRLSEALGFHFLVMLFLGISLFRLPVMKRDGRG